MAVEFILGRSGSGKSRRCIDSIIGELAGVGAEPLVLLVPEQATYQAERAILSNHKIPGYSRLNVLSFARLGYLLLGRRCAGARISRIGQQMAIHRILRQNADKLKVYGKSASAAGLAAKMSQIITELHSYGKDPDEVGELLERLKKNNGSK